MINKFLGGKMNIFITNDDGIEAIGIQTIARAMTKFGKA